MVAFQSDFEQVPELAVLGHVLRRQVAVVVEDRFALGVLVVQSPAGLGAEQKIFVDGIEPLNAD
jgi:hypothetical protein